MIYFDNSATTLQKPPGVAEAAANAIHHFGNPGRGSYPAAHMAAQTVMAARTSLAKLAGTANPAGVAFTSGATESLNLVISNTISAHDHVITTVLEHNSVLRPLYKTGCELDLIDCDNEGNLLFERLPALLKQNTRAIVCTHGSNLVGSLTGIGYLYDFCKANGLLFILDAAQTFGCVPLHSANADFICFTGHKCLYGPQGTGGVLASAATDLPIFKTGGTGENSFAPAQYPAMPDAFEAGTPNVPGLAGLKASVDFLLTIGQSRICQHETTLVSRLLDGLAQIPNVTIYGSKTATNRLPVTAINIGSLDSEDASLRLWEQYSIATRPGSHCAPLAHQRFGTQQRGMVRLSLGYFNTNEEVDAALVAIKTIARNA